MINETEPCIVGSEDAKVLLVSIFNKNKFDKSVSLELHSKEGSKN